MNPDWDCRMGAKWRPPHSRYPRSQAGSRCRFRFRAIAVTKGGGAEAPARPKMAEYVQVLKRALKHIGGHGGARGAILQLLR